MNREEILFRTFLKKHGYSYTQSRQKMFSVLQNHNSSTIAELTSLLHQFDRATVYRTVGLFEKLGVIDKVSVGWKHKLELSNIFQHHHHHLVCTNCHRVLMLKEDSVIEKRIEAMSKQGNFFPTDHQLEIRGLCSKCQRIDE